MIVAFCTDYEILLRDFIILNFTLVWVSVK